MKNILSLFTNENCNEKFLLVIFYGNDDVIKN